MSNNIKGITVEIGGDAGPLSSALKGVNKTAGDLQSELREVNRQLKFDPKNTTLLTQKIDLLKQNTQTLEEKQKTLKTAVQQAHAAFEKGELGADKVRAVEREYEKVNSQLKNSKQELNEVERTSGTFGERVKATFSSIGQSFRSAFNWNNVKAGLGAAGIAITAFLKGSVEEASEAQKSEANLEQSLKSTKGAAGMTMQSLNELTEAMMANTAFSKDEIESCEGMILTFTQIGKDVFPQVTAATLDYAQKMGVDAKSAALTLGKALNDPATGLSKLTKSGVTFTEQQKKQITAMQKAGDIAGAQKLMIAELNKEFGGQAAAAADTYAGKQKQLANMMKELKEVIGSAVIPVLNAILKPITPILQAIAKFVSENPKLTVGILALVGVIGTLVGGLSLANTVAGLFGHTMRLNEVLMTGGVMLGIMALIAAVALIITHWKQVSAFFVNLWNTVKGFFASIPGFFTVLWAKITGFFSRIPAFFVGVGNSIKGFFTGIGNSITGFFTGIWTSITGFFTRLGTSISTGFKNAWQAVVSFFTQSIPAFIASVGQWFQQLPYNIGLALGTAVKNIFNFGVSAANWERTELPKIINEIIQWFQQLPGRIWTFLVQVVTNIGTWGTNMWNYLSQQIPKIINGIGKWFSELPGRIWTSLTQAIAKISNWGNQTYSSATSAANRTVSGIGTWFSQLPGKIWAALLTALQNVKKWCTNLISTAATEIPKFVSCVVSFMQKLPGKMLDIGKNIVTGIWNGITGAGSWLWGKVTGWCNDLVAGFKKGLGIHSPSKLFADVIGKNLALGIGQGFSDTMKPVTASMAALIPNSFGDDEVQVHAAMAAAHGVAPTTRDAMIEQAASAVGANAAGGQSINLTVVTADGRTLGRFMAPYVGKELEFNAKNMFPARG